MKKNLILKVSLIVAVIACLVIAMIFIFFRLLKPLYQKIGLEQSMKGGMRLVVKVVTDEALTDQTNMSAIQLRSLFKGSSIQYERIARNGFKKIEITGTLSKDERKIKDILDDDFREWNYAFGDNLIAVILRPNIEHQLRDQSVKQTLKIIRDRLDQYGITKATIKKEDPFSENIIIEFPGIDNPERVKTLIKSTAMLEFRQVISGPFLTEEAALKDYNGKLPEDLEIVKTNPRRLDKGFYVLKAATVVPGKDLKSARRAQDEYGAPAVGFSFNSQGATQFEKFTAANIGKQLSIVLDNRIESVATIQDVISGDGIIHGRFTVDEVDDIVLVLRSGALPAPLKYIEERTI